MSWGRAVCSGALNWEGVQLSCSPTCSRMYCWQKQQGRSRVSPEHSQPHERMMVDYLQEMSYTGPPESQDSTLAAQGSADEDDRERWGRKSIFVPLKSFFFSFSTTDEKIGPHIIYQFPASCKAKLAKSVTLHFLFLNTLWTFESNLLGATRNQSDQNKKNTIVLNIFFFSFHCQYPILCHRLFRRTSSRWLEGAVRFPPPATLVIGKFTSLQGTTDSPVN